MIPQHLSLTLLSTDHCDLINDIPSLSEVVDKQLADENYRLRKSLLVDNPFNDLEASLIAAEDDFDLNTASLPVFQEHLRQYYHFLSKAKRPSDRKYWDKVSSRLTTRQKKSPTNEINTDHQHLLQLWRKKYDREYNQWELDKIASIQQQFLKQLSDWLEQLKVLRDAIESLGLEPGYLLDLSSGSLNYSDLEQLKKWAKYLTDDKGVKALCEMIGRLRQIGQSEKIETIKTAVKIPEMVFDDDSKQEIIGIKLGKDLEHVLPSELALMSNPNTDILFDLKYVESNLMCFDMAGIATEYIDQEIEIEQAVIEEDKKGPMIICIDTSGSMHGSPETIAKALTLYLSTQAKKEKRDCYLINFSTSIEVLDLSQGYSISTLLAFLQKSFHGGTDVAPAMIHGIEIMQKDSFKNADMLIISDFVMSSLPSYCLEQIDTQRELGNRFYSLCIGNHFMVERLKTHFDSEWIYNPRNSSISELLKFQDTFLDRIK